ncbi:MAG: hypothetical protein M1820_007149 [Bogoriella megaspora]|nr:MAG: hypothetical protein M1820_007149 [Bogoriella megaspora]
MTTAEPFQRNPFTMMDHSPNMQKSIPILPSTSATSSASPVDAMDVTPSHSGSSSMGPPVQNSPNGDRSSEQNTNISPSETPTTNGNTAPAVGAAAVAQQPKVVQTAFIHKLYNMLEDQSIQHLISWSNSNESFVMSPSNEFSKVLASYFKHTNISSFVRQLNMYGFHKVSDVFHTGSPDSPLWEFKHGNGSFRRGDLIGLREIKRRASRHALIHRESFSGASQSKQLPISQPATPAEPMPDPVEARLNALEHTIFDVHTRLNRAEETNVYLSTKCQMLGDGLIKCHQWSHDMSSQLMVLVPDPNNPIHRDAASMQRAISQQIEDFRSIEESSDAFLTNRPPIFNVTEANTPMSPRQLPQDDSRRPSLASISSRPSPSFRVPVPPHIMSPRRYGSIGTGSGAFPPSPSRGNQPQPTNTHLPPPPPPSQHPLASASSPPTNLPRRHTSADIRLHGWQGPGPENAPPHLPKSPFTSGQNSGHWPSSPNRLPIHPGDQEIRNALAAYELPKGPRTQGGSRQTTPPGAEQAQGEPSWNLPGARYPQFKAGGVGLLSTGFGPDGSAPGTRRSSMASNVHNLLNPAETAERAEEEDLGPEEKKRKR